MDTFSGEISIAELTALLFIVSLTLIPLTIWGVGFLRCGLPIEIKIDQMGLRKRGYFSKAP